MLRWCRLSSVVGIVAVVFGLVVPGQALAADNPQAVIRTPSADAGVAVGIPLLVNGSAFNGEAGGIVSVELSFDEGTSWQQVGDGENWAHAFTPDAVGPLVLWARASTNSTVGAVTDTTTVYVGSVGYPPARTCPCTFWPADLPDYPAIDDLDQEPVELGLRIRTDRVGYLTGLTVRRGTYTGSLIGRVWSDGTLLAERTTTGSVAAYQQITFTTPVPVQPGVDYVVSYYTPAGGYKASEYYFSGTMVDAPLSAVHDGSTGAGVYHYGTGGGFPTDSWHGSNYWVLPTFAT